MNLDHASQVVFFTAVHKFGKFITPGRTIDTTAYEYAEVSGHMDAYGDFPVITQDGTTEWTNITQVTEAYLTHEERDQIDRRM